MGRARNDGQDGFTLIELMIVVAIVGVLAVLAIYGVRKYIANAKTAEARAVVGQIGKNAISAFEFETSASNVIALGTSGSSTSRKLCSSSTAVPSSITLVAAKKYQSSQMDWSGTRGTGWVCLRFNMDNPQYFRYQYVASNEENANTGTFQARGEGDLNGDSVSSLFILQGGVTSGLARLAPTMDESNPEE